MSHPASANAAQTAPHSKGGFFNTALWVLQILTALAFLLAGTMKLIGAQEMVRTFDKIGVGQWFRYVTGGLEVLGALLLLVPSLCGAGALLLVCIMIGAIITHLTKIGGSPIPAVVLLCLSAVITLGRAYGRLRTRSYSHS